MSMIDGNILLIGYDVAGRVIGLIDALDRHDESYVIISDDSSTWMDYGETIESVMDVRLDDYDAVIIEITVDGLSDYDDDFDLIEEA